MYEQQGPPQLPPDMFHMGPDSGPPEFMHMGGPPGGMGMPGQPPMRMQPPPMPMMPPGMEGMDVSTV